MKKDPAIEEIRKTRREISRKFGHDTRAIIAHYRSLEPKYAGRLVRESVAEYSTQSVPGTKPKAAEGSGNRKKDAEL